VRPLPDEEGLSCRLLPPLRVRVLQPLGPVAGPAKHRLRSQGLAPPIDCL